MEVVNLPQATSAPPATARDRTKPSGLLGVLCASLVGLAVAVIYPVLEMGTNDDWSYVRTSLDLLRTGHLLYNGWATAMLGWQIYWGALFIKLFGAPFLATRLSTTVLGMASAYLLYRIFVWFGVNAPNAVLGTLTVVLSPVYLPNVTSFMSDVPGFFCVLLCLYACLRSLDAPSRPSAIAWLTVAAVIGVVGGTARQTAWLGALALVPSTAWILRRTRGVLSAAAVLWVASLVAIVGILHWYGQQPYAIPEKFLNGKPQAGILSTLLQQSRGIFLTVLLMATPVLTAFFTALPKVSKKILFGLLASSALAVAARSHGDHALLLAPWLPNMITEYGVLGNGALENLGTKPVIMPTAVRLLLSALILGATCAFFAALFSLGKAKFIRRTILAPSWSVTGLLLGPFIAGYVLLLVPRAVFVVTVDRYLIPLAALLLIPVLRYYQERVREHAPAISFAVLALFTTYGVAATHDYFATDRARLAAAEEVRTSGVPRTEIQGGWEYDSWTQLETSGYMNDSRLERPLGAYQPYQPAHRLPEACRFWFSDHTPAVDPQYFVVFSQQACLAPSRFRPVLYHAWLPPFERQISIQQLP